MKRKLYKFLLLLFLWMFVVGSVWGEEVKVDGLGFYLKLSADQKYMRWIRGSDETIPYVRILPRKYFQTSIYFDSKKIYNSDDWYVKVSDLATLNYEIQQAQNMYDTWETEINLGYHKISSLYFYANLTNVVEICSKPMHILSLYKGTHGFIDLLEQRPRQFDKAVDDKLTNYMGRFEESDDSTALNRSFVFQNEYIKNDAVLELQDYSTYINGIQIGNRSFYVDDPEQIGKSEQFGYYYPTSDGFIFAVGFPDKLDEDYEKEQYAITYAITQKIKSIQKVDTVQSVIQKKADENKISVSLAIDKPIKKRLNPGINTLQILNWIERGRDRNFLISNFRADDVAKALGLPEIKHFSDPDKYGYEWLHLSAHSLGTNDETIKPEDLENFVLGTCYANTKMIIYEDIIKRLAYYFNCRINLDVEAELVKLSDNTYATWLATKIIYKYDVYNKNGQKVPELSNIIEFNPFETINPSFEEYILCIKFHDTLADNLIGSENVSSNILPPLNNTLVTIPALKTEPFFTADYYNYSATMKHNSNLTRNDTMNNYNINPYPIKDYSAFLTYFNNTHQSTSNNFVQNAFWVIPDKNDNQIIPFYVDVIDSEFIEYQSNGFDFSQLFNNFNCDYFDQFIFDDTNLSFEEDPIGLNNIIIFDGTLRMDNGELSVFRDFLSSTNGLQISARVNIGTQTMSGKIKPQSIVLRSKINFVIPITDNIVLKQAALELDIKRKINYINNTAGWGITPSITGSLEFTSIGTSEPVTIDCVLTYSNGTLHVGAGCDRISGLFGVDNLDLHDVKINFDIGDHNNIDISGNIYTGIRRYGLGGKLSSNGSGLFVSVDQFTLYDLYEMFSYITRDSLSFPNYDITFNDMFIGLASESCRIGDVYLDKGLTLSGSMTANGFTSSSKIIISNNMISFTGTLGDFDYGPVHIRDGTMSMRLYSASVNMPSEFSIYGRSTIQGVEVDCELSYEKYQDTSNWVLYAALNGESVGISTFIPEAGGTFLDTLRFSNAAFIYATRDCRTQNPEYSFNVRRGLQIMADLEDIPALSELTGSPSTGCELNMYFGSTTDISINCPESRLNLGEAVQCDPFSIQITLAPAIAFKLIFGMNVIVPGQSDPLHFDVSLELGTNGAMGAGTMKGYWENPFGINNVRVGPELALQVGISYGVSPQIGFTGGLEIGDIKAMVALNVSSDPSKLILAGELSRLTPTDLAVIAKTIANIDIPVAQLPDFLEFHDVKLYCAPSGGTIGTIRFEPGFSFSGKMILYGKEVSTYTSLSANGFVSAGKIEGFDIGPLKIKGKEGEDARYRIELTSQTQSIFIDGAIEFLGASAAIFADISARETRIEFESELPLCGFSIKDAYIISNSEGIMFNGNINLGESYATITGEIYPDGTFMFKGSSALTIMGHTIANGEIEFSNELLSVKGYVGIGGSSVYITGLYKSNGTFNFEGTADLSMGGYQLAGARVSFNNNGLYINGTLVVLGVNSGFTGLFNSNGTYSLSGYANLNLAGFSMATDLRLTNNGLSASGSLYVLGAYSGFSGTIAANGTFSLTGSTTINFAGFAMATDLTLNNNGMAVSGTMDVLGSNTGFNGSITASGNFVLSGYTNINFAGFAMATDLTLNNSGLRASGSLNVLGTNVGFYGSIYSNGKFSLSGNGTVNIYGNYITAQFSLSNSGLSGSGTINFAGSQFNVSFSVDVYGRFNGSGSISLGPYGLYAVGQTLGELRGTATLSISNNIVSVSFSGQACVFGNCTTIRGSIDTSGVVSFYLDFCLPEICLWEYQCSNVRRYICRDLIGWRTVCTTVCVIICGDICLPEAYTYRSCNYEYVTECNWVWQCYQSCYTINFSIDLF